MHPHLFIGTAGWSIPRASRSRCGGEGTHLERYARVCGCVEINSSFYRPHASGTYARWADSTPDAFRFAVKVPKVITHVKTLRRSRAELQQFLDETAGLGAKRGPLLVQLPPSLAFDSRVAGRFFALLRSMYGGPVVCEPRHSSWFGPAEALLVSHEVARVAADPPPAAGADVPAGWTGLTYFRLHGSPDKYWSSYTPARIAEMASALRACTGECWCVFDNTAKGAAFENACQLQDELLMPSISMLTK